MADLALLGRTVLIRAETAAVAATIARHDAWLHGDDARLAHGDLDLIHIYQDKGEYTGIIDFGEIRGADRLYDLGHFNLHDVRPRPSRCFPHCWRGTGRCSPSRPSTSSGSTCSAC